MHSRRTTDSESRRPGSATVRPYSTMQAERRVLTSPGSTYPRPRNERRPADAVR